MENPEPEEPEKKRLHLDTSVMARNSISSPNNNKSVDAGVLQYQNQKLVQQLETQKQELHDIETKIKELKDKQNSYDDMLISVNRLWNQLVDDVIMLGVRAGGGLNALKSLDRAEHSRGSIPPCPPEETFLCRLLESDFVQTSGNGGVMKYVEEALASRRSLTIELMKFLEDTIAAEREKTESIAQALHGNISAEDTIIQLSKIDDMMKEEAKNLHEVIDALHSKHKEYADGIQTYIRNQSVDQSEIKRIKGELEEVMAELEESRRKLVNLKMQKDIASRMHVTSPVAVNGSLSPEKPEDKGMGLQELKDSIEEAEVVAADRLSELQEAREQNLMYSKQLVDLENEVKDEKYVYSSRLYTLLNDQLQHWNAEMERYKALTDALQADRSLVMRREKELNVKAELADAARNTIHNSDSRVEELETQLQKCIMERNDLEIKMEEAIQDAGRNDIKAEFSVMASALSKEMGIMEAQLNRWKETAHEAISLREEAQSLKALLNTKSNEQKHLVDKCAEQMTQIKTMKGLVEKLQKENLELQIFLDMYGQEGYDNRDIVEIKESEHRAHSQAEVLRNALDEHSLELRVKAANEAEAACQQRLSIAEAEIAELRAKLDASERDVFELTEAIKIKDKEAETYISEIETIGQAYEDMQTQNQNLLQQMTERDDYNIKLVSESVKTKQAHSLLLAEKQTLSKQLQQVNASIESVKVRMAHSEEQMKGCLTEGLKASQEDRHLVINLETTRWELADAEKELKWLKSALTSSEREYELVQRKVDEFQGKLDKERNERKDLEEELEEVNREIARLTSETGEAAIQKLQDEIKNCKNILKCGVCFDRPKEVVIVKCYHLFCNPCIQRNLEIRHRKCPGCGTAFGQNDVRFVKI
ncbi:hypothetical protein SLE2022_357980 [Rubroshorea leprosula]